MCIYRSTDMKAAGLDDSPGGYEAVSPALLNTKLGPWLAEHGVEQPEDWDGDEEVADGLWRTSEAANLWNLYTASPVFREKDPPFPLLLFLSPGVQAKLQAQLEELA